MRSKIWRTCLDPLVCRAVVRRGEFRKRWNSWRRGYRFRPLRELNAGMLGGVLRIHSSRCLRRTGYALHRPRQQGTLHAQQSAHHEGQSNQDRAAD